MPCAFKESLRAASGTKADAYRDVGGRAASGTKADAYREVGGRAASGTKAEESSVLHNPFLRQQA